MPGRHHGPQRGRGKAVRARGARALYAVGLVAAATALSLPIRQLVEPTNLVMLYLAAVLVAGLYLGRGPALLVSILGTLSFDFFMVPPYLTLTVHAREYFLTFAGLLLVSLVISSLATRAREQADVAQRRRTEAMDLYELGRLLAASADVPEVVRAVLGYEQRSVGASAAILLEESGRLKVVAATPGFQLEADDVAQAQQAFDEPSGAPPVIGDMDSSRYLPLRSGDSAMGVMAARLADAPTSDEERLLASSASLAALAIERITLAEKAEQVELLKATEHLQSALLDSLSHELRTPLATITGVLSSLREWAGRSSQPALPATESMHLLDTALEEARRLNHLVGNLLDMTRLQSGALRLRKEPTDIQDLIGAVLAQMGRRLEDQPVEIRLAPDLPLVPLDFVLVAQVLVNLLDNALKYSPPGRPIEVAAQTIEDELMMTVRDHGPGIPPADLERVFEKFHQAPGVHGSSGTGLGLAISRGVVVAHGGSIRAENAPGGGAILSFRLPLREATGE